MSQPKRDQSFPQKVRAISDDEMAKIVATLLREDFGKTPSAIKRIGLIANVSLRTIKNWYSAKNAPSSGHLLLLARSSPSILKFILTEIGGEDLKDAFLLLDRKSEDPENTAMHEQQQPVYGAKNCTIKNPDAVSALENLNRRQVWFLDELRAGRSARSKDICARWDVALRTAKADVTEMVTLRLLMFKGSKKTGRYVLL